jgi:hypothetical protein
MRLGVALIIVLSSIRSAAQTPCSNLDQRVQDCFESELTQLFDISECVLQSFSIDQVIACVDVDHMVPVANFDQAVASTLYKNQTGKYFQLKKILVEAASQSQMDKLQQAMSSCPENGGTYNDCLCSWCVGPCKIDSLRTALSQKFTLETDPSNYSCKAPSCTRSRRRHESAASESYVSIWQFKLLGHTNGWSRIS